MTREENPLYKNRQERKTAVGQMLKEALRGAEALKEEDTESYLNTMEERERLIRRIDALDAKFSELERSNPPADAALKEALSALESETRENLKAVSREDALAREKGEALLKEYRKKLKSLRESGEQVMGYTKMYQQTDAVFLDKKR